MFCDNYEKKLKTKTTSRINHFIKRFGQRSDHLQ